MNVFPYFFESDSKYPRSLSLVLLLDNKSTLDVNSTSLVIIKSGRADINVLWKEQLALHFSLISSYKKNKTVQVSFASTINSLFVLIS